MNKFVRWYRKRALKIALGKCCAERIHRSGEKGKKENCFSVDIKNSETGVHNYLPQSLEDEEVKCKEWNGARFDGEVSVPLDDILEADLEIMHYWGLNTICFKSFGELLFHHCTKVRYIKKSIVNAFDSMEQYFFNQEKLVSRNNYELLKHLVKEHPTRLEGAGLLTIMNELHSHRWYRHPDAEEEMQRLKLYLDGLIAEGLIEKDARSRYSVKGLAISKMEKFEEEERRHKDNIMLRWIAIVMTGLVALLAYFQASGGG